MSGRLKRRRSTSSDEETLTEDRRNRPKASRQLQSLADNASGSVAGRLKDCDEDRKHQCLVYIAEKKLSAGHLAHLKGVAKKKGFMLASKVR